MSDSFRPYTVAHRVPLGFCKQEYWSGLPFPSPGYLPNPGIEPRSPVLQVDSLLSESPGKLMTSYPYPYECIAYPFSKESSRPRNQTGVSSIAGGFFTSWATREAFWFNLLSIKWKQVSSSPLLQPLQGTSVALKHTGSCAVSVQLLHSVFWRSEVLFLCSQFTS